MYVHKCVLPLHRRQQWIQLRGFGMGRQPLHPQEWEGQAARNSCTDPREDWQRAGHCEDRREGSGPWTTCGVGYND